MWTSLGPFFCPLQQASWEDLFPLLFCEDWTRLNPWTERNTAAIGFTGGAFGPMWGVAWHSLRRRRGLPSGAPGLTGETGLSAECPGLRNQCVGGSPGAVSGERGER